MFLYGSQEYVTPGPFSIEENHRIQKIDEVRSLCGWHTRGLMYPTEESYRID